MLLTQPENFCGFGGVGNHDYNSCRGVVKLRATAVIVRRSVAGLCDWLQTPPGDPQRRKRFEGPVVCNGCPSLMAAR